MNTKNPYLIRLLLSFAFLLFFVSYSFANEGGKILGNAAPIVLLFIFFLALFFGIPILIFFKTAKSRYLALTTVNSIIALLVYWHRDDFFIIDAEYILGFQLTIQIIASVFFGIYFMDKKKKQAKDQT